MHLWQHIARGWNGCVCVVLLSVSTVCWLLLRYFQCTISFDSMLTTIACTIQPPLTIDIAVYYNGVTNSGIENNVAYMTADLSLWSLHFNLVDMLQVPLCDESMVADSSNQNECPGDGAHKYEFEYLLPTAGSEHTSWLASGWKGTGLIQLFAEQNENMKIGECTLSLNTYVTRKSAQKNLLGMPSAATALGMLVALLIVLAALAMYVYCCCCNRKNRPNRIRVKKDRINSVTYDRDDENDEDAAHFKRMEDEKSFWSGSGKGSKKSKKSSTETSSIVSDLP
jgi:hypothetical protein